MADEDIRKYLPTAADILRRADDEAAKKRLERALDNPDLDAALAGARTRTNEGEDPLYYEVKQDEQGRDKQGCESLGAAPVAPLAAAPVPVTAPVTVPAVGPSAPRPRLQVKPPRVPHARRPLSSAATIAVAAMAVATSALLVAVLKGPAKATREPSAAATAPSVAVEAVMPGQTARTSEVVQNPTAPSAVAPVPGQPAEPTASSSAAVPPPATSGNPAVTRSPVSPSRDVSPPSPSGRKPDSNLPEQFF